MAEKKKKEKERKTPYATTHSITDFEKGDRVKYVSHYHGDSESVPLWGGQYGMVGATVTDVESNEGAETVFVQFDDFEYNGREFSGDQWDFDPEDLDFIPQEVTADDPFSALAIINRLNKIK